MTFHAGDITKTISITVTGDPLEESDETFWVELFNPQGATIADRMGVVTIQDDDSTPPPPSFVIDDVPKREGRSGRETIFIFTVTRTGDTSQAASIWYATADGTAVAGEDYLAASGWLTFAEGETTKAISVTVKGDLLLPPPMGRSKQTSHRLPGITWQRQGSARRPPVPSVG